MNRDKNNINDNRIYNIYEMLKGNIKINPKLLKATLKKELIYSMIEYIEAQEYDINGR